MTPDQYRREGAEAMREAAAEHCWAMRWTRLKPLPARAVRTAI